MISGYVLRLLRESAALPQSRLAELLGVDLGTLQGWESGRRPLGNVRGAELLQLRRRLAALGAAGALFGWLDAAMDADLVLAAALQPPEDLALHPLAGWVQSRESAHLVAWAVRGITPPGLAPYAARTRRGPVPTGPHLSAADREAFFLNLRRTSEIAGSRGDRTPLRRQTLYLSSYDPAPDAEDWAAHALAAMRPALALRGYTPRWIEARTAATVAARQGDPEPLIHFVATALSGDQHGELANLGYWAYWLGAMPADQADDAFLDRPESAAWNPLALFRGLVGSMHPAPGTVDLYVHSVTTLLDLHPWLSAADPATTRHLLTLTANLLDLRVVSSVSARALESVHYRLQQTT
ncbi:transcriptional regulator with XRE-family HTH domain [Kitasatospora herbaricolor]|uniref:helix-turn-helix domain-containing protein n=1 Tax=Kitasatospora herbaricolor TaxID=68217 RepID=UPI001748A18D|nr:helix-turn-helix transcriptional regulator [Kitasatospora herbaricolor]MDQ0305759.1 transcriptional regulator with XRE-family HTH domain [Kitasatospora herbaricolor]